MVSEFGKKKKKKEPLAKGATLSSGRGPSSAFPRRNQVRRERKTAPLSSSGNLTIRPIPDTHRLPQVIRFLVSKGIAVDFYKEKYIARRLRVRMGRLGIRSYEEYLTYLRRHNAEILELKESLSINVTRFFRNRDTFDIMKTKIFPQVVSTLRKKEYNIWSAGCAVGAEPYTVSIIADEFFRRHGIEVKVLATDVNEDLLKIARQGKYTPPYLAEMTENEARQYFREDSEGNYEISPIIKSRVTFKRHDLTKDKFPRGFDLIVCRNVLIYIDKEAQNQIISKFLESLNPGGILVLGRTETLLSEWSHQVKTLSGIHRIYQKLDGDGIRQIDAARRVITPVPPSTEPRRLVGSRRREPRSSRLEKIASSSSRVQSRLEELRDFRKKFEEKKRLWEERMEQNPRNTWRTAGTHIGSLSGATGRRIRTSSSRTMDKEETRIRANFRSLLKPVKGPIRRSRIRTDDPVKD